MTAIDNDLKLLTLVWTRLVQARLDLITDCTTLTNTLSNTLSNLSIHLSFLQDMFDQFDTDKSYPLHYPI